MKRRNREKRLSLFLKSLYLRNFRNFKESCVEFSPNLNVIYGDNAQGKTSILEAISLITLGRSFRTSHISELIFQGSDFFFLEAEFIKEGFSNIVKLSFDGKTKKAHINSHVHNAFTPLIGTYPCIISIPEDVQIIYDSPQIRRKFLDLYLAQSDPLYVHYLSRYWKALKQRNCLLKQKSIDAIECFESEMASSAQYIILSRLKAIEQLEPKLQIHGNKISDTADLLGFSYLATCPNDPMLFLEILKKNRKKEMDFGSTIIGPHRDDINFTINGRSAHKFASKGQVKTLVTALKLSLWENLETLSGMPPLFAIDDFEETLDQNRKQHLTTYLENMRQVFITTPKLYSPDSESYNFLPILVRQGNAFV